LRQSLGTLPSDVDDFVIEDAEQLRAANDEMVKLLSIVLVLLVSISLFVGGIGVMNVLLVSVFERTREIGILLALGATRNQIRLQFLIEAGILSLFGAFLGVIIGWILSHGIVYLALPRVESAVVPLWTVLSAIGVTICVGVLAGVFPAIRAANLDPIEALAAE
jgi:putative ABC transport system permease protein